MINETKIYKYRWMILAIAWIAYFVMYLQQFPLITVLIIFYHMWHKMLKLSQQIMII